MQNECDYDKEVPSFLKNSDLLDVVVTDLNGDYVYVNTNFKNRFSFITSDFIGKPSAISIHKDDVAKAETVVMKCLSQPGTPVKVELRKPLEFDGGYFWTQWEFSVLMSTDQIPIGILCVGYDITKPKRNVLALQESRERLKKTLEVIPHPLLIISNEDQIEYVNQEFEKVIGFSADEILDKTIDILFPEEFGAEYEELLNDYKASQQRTVKLEKYLYCRNKFGRKIAVGASLSSFQTSKGLNIVIVLEDLTSFKAYQDTIINQNKALRSISWRHSHEIRKPVANILALSDLFNYENKPNTPYKQTIDYIKEAVIELDSLTKKIVTEANKSEFRSKIQVNRRL